MTSKRPIAILKMGDTLAEISAKRGDFDRWFIDGLGIEESDALVLDAPSLCAFPDLAQLRGVVMTGSSSMVTEEEPWSERCIPWIRDLVEAELPLLGVCYGHQLVAKALGGEVGVNPKGREIGTIEVRLEGGYQEDPLFRVMPAVFKVQATHRQSVLSLPRGASRLGANDKDNNQVYRVGKQTWGVQFHPEFDAEIIRGYIEGRREALTDEGLRPDELLESAVDTPYGWQLLRQFASLT